jgi:hypothetical protein
MFATIHPAFSVLPGSALVLTRHLTDVIGCFFPKSKQFREAFKGCRGVLLEIKRVFWEKVAP